MELLSKTEDGDLTKSDFLLSNEMRKLTTVDSVECKSNLSIQR